MPRSTSLAVVLSLTVAAAPLGAQAPEDTAAVRDDGSGPVTWVLLTGMVGGVAGYRRLASRLLARGDRVIVIDAYRSSLDSADVTFAALARRVDAILDRHGITQAHVVGHAHGGGIGLRLAASSPLRVADLTLVDVGAQASNKGPVLSASMRLVPFIARIPGGRSFLRRRFVAGLHENSARHEWLDTATVRAYAEPLLADVDRLVAMAMRVANAREPESVDSVLARVHVPVTIVLGGVHTPAGPTEEEMSALVHLPRPPRTLKVDDAGHFVHEEAPDELAALLPSPQVPEPRARVLRTRVPTP